jgi:hypothetical protein
MPSPSSFLRLESLESREVPAVLDLTSAGASGVVNGALFRQSNGGPAGLGQTESIVRLQDPSIRGVEQGYNTDARPLQFDEARNRDATQSVKVGELPLVTIGGTQYREVVLDINETRHGSKVSLDELRVYVGTAGNLRGYNDRTEKLAGLTAVYDLDAGRGDNWIKLDAKRGSRSADMQFLIPAAALGSADGFVYLYSKFGEKAPANGGGEQWLHRVSAPAPTPTKASFSGTIYGAPTDEGGGINPVVGGTLYLYHDGSIVAEVTVGDDGTFSFTGVELGGPEATFTLVYASTNPNDPPLAENSATVTLFAGDTVTDAKLYLSDA